MRKSVSNVDVGDQGIVGECMIHLVEFCCRAGEAKHPQAHQNLSVTIDHGGPMPDAPQGSSAPFAGAKELAVGPTLVSSLLSHAHLNFKPFFPFAFS